MSYEATEEGVNQFLQTPQRHEDHPMMRPA